MRKIPKAQPQHTDRIKPSFRALDSKNQTILFSFEAIEKNEYFNLDATCQNWANDLFDTMQKVSKISSSDIYAGKYSGKNSTLRIHMHDKVKKPCAIPKSVSLEDLWQIRISKRKGGIHGVLIDNIFFVIWFDPHHNLYPDENYGGLKKIKPPLTCCKDREEEIEKLQMALAEAEENASVWQKLAEEYEENQKHH